MPASGSALPASDLSGGRPDGDSLVVLRGDPRSPASPAGPMTSRAARTVLPRVLPLPGASEATHALRNDGTAGAIDATTYKWLIW